MVKQRLWFTGATAAGLIFLHERAQQLPLLETKQPFEALHILLEILLGLFGLIVVLGIEEHSGAHADLPLLAHEDLVVHTAFATGPEGLVLRELRIGNRLIAEIAVDLHYGEAGGESEDLRFRIFLPGEIEYFLLDGFGDTALTEFGRDDESRIGDIFAVAPGLDIAESHPCFIR